MDTMQPGRGRRDQRQRKFKGYEVPHQVNNQM